MTIINRQHKKDVRLPLVRMGPLSGQPLPLSSEILPFSGSTGNFARQYDFFYVIISLADFYPDGTRDRLLLIPKLRYTFIATGCRCRLLSIAFVYRGSGPTTCSTARVAVAADTSIVFSMWLIIPVWTVVANLSERPDRSGKCIAKALRYVF